MSSFAELLQQGTAQAWLYFPSAILLGRSMAWSLAIPRP